MRRFVGVSSSNMKSPEQGESLTVPSFISLYDNCGTAGAAPLADPSAAQHMYSLGSHLSAQNIPALGENSEKE